MINLQTNKQTNKDKISCKTNTHILDTIIKKGKETIYRTQKVMNKSIHWMQDNDLYIYIHTATSL